MIDNDRISKINKGLALIAVALIVVLLLFEIDINVSAKYSLFKKSDRGQAISGDKLTNNQSVQPVGATVNVSELQKKVVPDEGVELPINWNSLGKKMIADGVIDEDKLRQVFRNNLGETEDAILSKSFAQPIVMTQDNSRFILDVLWAFGLANKNEILESGEMVDQKYGGDAGKFASTGGWTLSKGKPMDHYSMHRYISLTPAQQALVNNVSQGIYRPCCGNSTHFPDCNHGMAMLGLLELMAANNVSEEEMYKVALQANSYWFPQTYIDLATYFEEQGTDWSDVNPQLALSKEYSSSAGYRQIKGKIQSAPQPVSGGGGCGA